VSIQKIVGDALAHIGCRQAIFDKISYLQNSEIWKLVPLPSAKFIIGCRWVFAIKFCPHGTIDHLKSHLVVKGYTQYFGLYYGDTTTIKLLHSDRKNQSLSMTESVIEKIGH